MLFGREFHRAAVEVFISRLPYLTILLWFGNNDVVDEERKKSVPMKQLPYVRWCCSCNTLNVNTRSFN